MPQDIAQMFKKPFDTGNDAKVKQVQIVIDTKPASHSTALISDLYCFPSPTIFLRDQNK